MGVMVYMVAFNELGMYFKEVVYACLAKTICIYLLLLFIHRLGGIF